MSGIAENVMKGLAVVMPEPEDYKGEDGLLYCGKCHKPKEAYFPKDKVLFGIDRHPAECVCRMAERESRSLRIYSAGVTPKNSLNSR